MPRTPTDDYFRNTHLNPRDAEIDEAGQALIRCIVERYVPSLREIAILAGDRRNSEIRELADRGVLQPLEYSDSEKVQAELRRQIEKMHSIAPEFLEDPLVVFADASAYKNGVGLEYFVPYKGAVFGAGKDHLKTSRVYAEALNSLLLEFGASLVEAFRTLGCLNEVEARRLTERMARKIG